jgi:tetratricopeptide (TPR) repeat protein
MRRWLPVLTLFVCYTAISAAPDVVDVFQNGAQHLWESRWDEAASQFRQGAQLDPENPLTTVALFNAANIELLINEDPEEAMELYRGVVNRAPESVWAAESWRRMAECAESLSDNDHAVEYLGKALNIGSSYRDQLTDAWTAQVSLAMVGILSQLDDIDAAVAHYKSLREQVTQGEPAAQIRFGLGQGHENRGDLKNAALAYREVAEHYAHTNTARRLADKRHLLTEQLDYDWGAFDLYLQTDTHVRTGNTAEAINLSRQILDKYPDTGLARLAEFRVLVLETFDTGDFRKGMDRLLNMIVDHPNWSRSDNARDLVEQWEDIANRIDRAKQNPDNLDVHRTLGFQFLRSRAWGLAQQYFNHVLEHDPDDASAHMGMGNALVATGRTEESVSHFEACLAANPNDGNTLNQLGYIYLGAGDYHRARDMFHRYIEADTTVANAYDSMGECLLNEGRYDESIRHYRKALSLDPAFSNSQFMLGQACKGKGDTAQAIIEYTRYLEMDPGGRLEVLARTNLDSLRVNVPAEVPESD